MHEQSPLGNVLGPNTSPTTDDPALVVTLSPNGNTVQLIGGGAGGADTQYAEGTTQVTPVGTVALGKNPSNALHPFSLDVDGNLKVNVAVGGAGGGGGAVTVADGADAALGTTADGAYVSGPGTLISLLKGIFARLVKGSATAANSLPVVIASDQAAVPVSGSFFPGTQPVSAAALPLPAGAATSAKQPALGANVMANASPVTLASDQPAVPVSAAALPLPSGAATSAKQPALGAATMANATPVTLASDQPAVPVSATALPLPAGAATSAKQPALGANIMANAAPVTLASDQPAVPTNAADGAIVALGTTTDAVYAAGAGTLVGLLKGLFARLAKGVATSANSLSVVLASDQASIPVGAGGIYNTSNPTLTNAQRGDLQLDVHGNLMVNPRPLAATTDVVGVQPVPGFTFPANAALYSGFGDQIASYSSGGSSGNGILTATVPPKALLSVAAGTVIAVGTVTSADIDVSHFSELAWDIKTTAGTGTIAVTINRKGADGTYYPIYQSGALPTATTQSASLGRAMPTPPTSTTPTGYGAFACSIGQTIQVVTTVATSTVTCGYSLIAKM